MAKIPKRRLGEKLRNDSALALVAEIKNILSIADLERFMDKFFSGREKESIFRRFAILVEISRGKKYRDIKEELEVSGSSVSRIKHSILGTSYAGKKKMGYSFGESAKKKKIRWPKYKGAPHLF